MSAQLIPDEFDKIELTYTGDDLTSVVYKSQGRVKVTLTLTYTAGVLQTVTRA